VRVFRVVLAGILAVGLAAGTTGCAQADAAARVNGEVIENSRLEQEVASMTELSPQMFEGPEGESRLLEFRQVVLNRLIEAVLIAQAAEELGIEVTDAQVQESLDQLRAGFAEEQQFEQALTQSGLTLEGLREQLRNQLITERLLEKIDPGTEVTEADINEYYEANKANQFTEEAATRASHILFEAADKATAERVLGEIRGGADFAELARQHSKDPASATAGGDLGWPTVPFVPEFQQALEGLDIGEVSALVETQFGWHIIKAVEKRAERVIPLSEAKESIEQMITDQRRAESYQSYIAELREKADIEILIPELAQTEESASREATP